MCRIYPVTSASANLYVTLHQLQFLKRGCLLIYPGFNKMTGNDWVDFTKWYEYISHNCIWDSALYLREEDSAQLHLSQYYRSPKQVVTIQSPWSTLNQQKKKKLKHFPWEAHCWWAVAATESSLSCSDVNDLFAFCWCICELIYRGPSRGLCIWSIYPTLLGFGGIQAIILSIMVSLA